MKKIYLLLTQSMLMPLLLILGGVSTASAQYCIPSGLSCTAGDALQSFYTTGAAVNINNTNSGCSPNGYGDYTNDTLKITAGGSFVANVLPEYYAGAAIWIDFNQDYDFNDPGEKVFGHGAVFSSTMTGTITIPLSGISYGTTRMRVAVGYVSEPTDPCSPGGFGYGEAEDYSINIQAPPQNDMLVSRIVVPDTTVLAGQSNIAIELINAGVQSQTPAVSFSNDNGNTWINENVSQTINSGDTLLYNFSATADFSNPGNYTCIAAVNIPGDTVNPYNDTLTVNVGSYLGNTIPFYENFETTSYNDWFSNYYDNYISVTYSWRLDSGRTVPRNTGPLSDHTTAGSYDGRYITTKPSAVDAHYVSPYLDTTTYPANPELKFYYFLHGDGGNIYVEEKIDGIWHRIDSMLGPVQANMQEPWMLQTTPLSSNASQFRFVGTYTGGGNIAIDDIYITGDNDLSVTDVIAPVPTIEQQNNSDVIIEVTNLGYNTQSNFDVKYSIDGGITYITETISSSIDPDSTLIYTFNTSADLTATGSYDMEFIVANSGDVNTRNDTVHKVIRNMSMPYSQNFDDATPLNLPHGWDYNLGIDDGWVETRGSSSLTAPNSLNLWNGSADSGEPLMAILPPYYGSFTDKWIQIWIDSNSDQDSVFVGVMDNPADASTFTPTDTITFSQTSNYAPHYGLLSNYTGTGKYIAIRHSVSSTYSYMWLDNLKFETAPNGPRLSAHPDSLDLHQVLYNVPDTITRMLQLYNDGPGILNITNTSVTGPHIGNFTLIDNNNYPQALNYGDSLYIEVKFHGDSLGAKTAFLSVAANSSVDSVKIYGHVVDAKIDTFPHLETVDHFGLPPIGWFARSTGNYQWYLNTGDTPDIFTGPNGDHNTGTGYYVYAEASIGNHQDEAMLITPEIDFSAIMEPTMNFWYHMYGFDIDTLSIDVAVNGSWINMIDTIIGQQQPSSSAPWEMHSVDLSAYANLDSIRLRSKRGLSSAADIALDDFALGTNYINLGADTALCGGDTITLDASLGGTSTRTYKWYVDQMNTVISTNPTLSTDSAGTYYVEIEDIGNFSGTDSITITTGASPNVQISGPDTMYYADTITLDAGAGFASYLWSSGDTVQTITLDYTDMSPGANTFAVTVTNSAGCSATNNKVVFFIDDNSIKESGYFNHFSIYPNPNQGRFTLTIDGPDKTMTMKILDSRGKLISESEIEVGQFSKQINLEQLSAGVYYIKLLNDEMTSTKKLIIE